MNSRYIELQIGANNGNELTFSGANPETVVPRGIYMLFAVTNTSVSHAIWVRFLP